MREIDREIVRLTVPALGALAIEPIFLVSDSAIVGHLGTPQLAGLGVGSAVLLNLVNLCLFLTFATTAAVSRRVGFGDVRAAASAGMDALWLASALGFAVAVFVFAMSDTAVRLFGPGSSASGFARTYLGISVFGIPSMLIVLAATGVMRGLGEAWRPLWLALVSGVTNILLNLFFVYGLGLGIAGSALGTVITQTMAAIIATVLVVRTLRRHGAALRPRLQGLRALSGGSFALFVRTLSLRVALLGMTYVAARQGEIALASHQSGLTVSGLFELPSGALGIAAQMVVSRELGRGAVDDARTIVRRSIRWGLVSGVILAVMLVALSPLFAQLYTHDPAVRSQLIRVLFVIALLQPIGGVLWVLDGVFIGAGDGRFLAVAGVGTLIGFVPVLLLIHVMRGTLVDLWLGLGFYLALRLVALLIRLAGGRWVVTGAVV